MKPTLHSQVLAVSICTLAGCAPSHNKDNEIAVAPLPTTAPQVLATATPQVLATLLPTPKPIVDSAMSLQEALQGKKFPRSIRDDLVLVEVPYLGYDEREHRGQLVVHRDLQDDVRAIFAELRALDFPLEKVVPIVRYDWSDGDSMADNNTSAFNYRVVSGRGGLSQHALGRAIDINPFCNPCIRDGMTFPKNAHWDKNATGTVMAGPVVRAFTRRGWRWGGDWRRTNITDYQHFEKLAPGAKPRFY